SPCARHDPIGRPIVHAVVQRRQVSEERSVRQCARRRLAPGHMGHRLAQPDDRRALPRYARGGQQRHAIAFGQRRQHAERTLFGAAPVEAGPYGRNVERPRHARLCRPAQSMIPNRFHFVFGLRDEPEPFHLVFYLCLASCRRWHPTADILFHCHHVPFGRYWDLARDLGLTLVPVEPAPFVASFRYPDRTLDKYRYAHHSDVIRLDALIAHGGVYADIDTLFLTPIPDDLRRHPF